MPMGGLTYLGRAVVVGDEQEEKQPIGFRYFVRSVVVAPTGR